MSNRRKGKMTTEKDGVEALLREAEDDVLLKLSVDSHMSRGSAANFIDPDLDRRFRALKFGPNRRITATTVASSTKAIPPVPKKPSIDSVADNKNGDVNNSEVDDLLARFSVLKGSLPSQRSKTSSSSSSLNANWQQECDEEEDEVEKVIKWAIDAARLDPSPPSCSDDDCNTDHNSSDDSEIEDDDQKLDSGKK